MSTSATKLTPAIKHLLTLRNPNPRLTPSVERLQRTFESTLSRASEHNAFRGWLVLTTSTILGCNSPASVGHLYRFATRVQHRVSDIPPLAHRVETAAIMRESALKGSIFIGVAMTINNMAALMEAVEPEVKAELRKTSVRELQTDNADAIMERGKALWRSIYQPHAEKLQSKLGSYHPDFPLFILQAYGSVLSPLFPPMQGNLNRVETSLVGIATLRALGGVGPQLISHVFGLLKARTSECSSDADRWLSGDEGAQWSLEAVDELVDAIRGDSDRVKL